MVASHTIIYIQIVLLPVVVDDDDALAAAAVAAVNGVSVHSWIPLFNFVSFPFLFLILLLLLVVVVPPAPHFRSFVVALLLLPLFLLLLQSIGSLSNKFVVVWELSVPMLYIECQFYELLVMLNVRDGFCIVWDIFFCLVLGQHKMKRKEKRNHLNRKTIMFSAAIQFVKMDNTTEWHKPESIRLCLILYVCACACLPGVNVCNQINK